MCAWWDCGFGHSSVGSGTSTDVGRSANIREPVHVSGEPKSKPNNDATLKDQLRHLASTACAGDVASLLSLGQDLHAAGEREAALHASRAGRRVPRRASRHGALSRRFALSSGCCKVRCRPAKAPCVSPDDPMALFNTAVVPRCDERFSGGAALLPESPRARTGPCRCCVEFRPLLARGAHPGRCCGL